MNRPKRAKPLNESEWAGLVYPPISEKDISDANNADMDFQEHWETEIPPIVIEGLGNME